MKSKKCIAILGRSRSGKDSCADYLCSKLGCNKYALAAPLKELVCNLFQISIQDLDKFKNEHWSIDAYDILSTNYYESDYRRLDTTFRSILQRAGDSIKDFFGISVFLSKVHEKIKDEDLVVISDVRLKEEQAWLMSHRESIFIKVERPTPFTKDSLHRTETEADSLSWDYLIVNDGTLEDLYKQLDLIIKKI